METLINPNQIRDGGSSKEIKILNVVQNGTLYRNGAVFSGFSGNNYLRFGARVDKGILSLDSSTYYKNFSLYASTANSWEMVFKVKYVSYNDAQMIFAQNNNYASQLYINSEGKICFAVGNGVSFPIEIIGTQALNDNTNYWIKFSYDSSGYKIYISTDGNSYNLYEASNDNTKISNMGYYDVIGKLSDAFSFKGEIDISETYIKINGEYWWKGVETL